MPGGASLGAKDTPLPAPAAPPRERLDPGALAIAGLSGVLKRDGATKRSCDGRNCAAKDCTAPAAGGHSGQARPQEEQEHTEARVKSQAGDS